MFMEQIAIAETNNSLNGIGAILFVLVNACAGVSECDEVVHSNEAGTFQNCANSQPNELQRTILFNFSSIRINMYYTIKFI